MALSYHVQLNGFLADFEAKRSPYDDSGSDSGDQFRPAEHPESEDEDDYLEDNVEPEAELEHEDEAKSEPTKAKSKKGKLKLGCKDIIATRKTNATAGMPSTATTTVNSGTHEKKGNARWDIKSFLTASQVILLTTDPGIVVHGFATKEESQEGDHRHCH